MKPSIWPHFTANDVLYYLQHTGSGLEAWNLPRYTFQPTHAILILGCLIDWNFLIFFLFWEFHGKWKRWRRKSTETDISFSWYNFSSVTWKSSAFSIFSDLQPPHSSPLRLFKPWWSHHQAIQNTPFLQVFDWRPYPQVFPFFWPQCQSLDAHGGLDHIFRLLGLIPFHIPREPVAELQL